MTNNFALPEIPSYITVHLGSVNEDVENVTVSFSDYIKGVASSQLDPNIPEQALYAIIYAQITLALDRILNNSYRSKGYSFDITNDVRYDQNYVYMIPVYRNINNVVDRIFTQYISENYSVLPISAEVCYEETRCRGLSVSGSIEMAENGMNYEEILRYYFGRNIYIQKNAVLTGLQNELMLDYPLYLGQSGSAVSGLQIALNRISANYTSIPYIDNTDGVYGEKTADAVKEFQRIFDLAVTGSFEKETYHKMLYVYNSIKQLNYLVEQGIELSDILPVLRADLSYGSVGNIVKLLQYYLLFVSAFDNRVPPLQIIGVFGEKTYQSVVAFQKIFGFEPNGVVNDEVWNTLVDVYEGLYASLPSSAFSEIAVPYFGNIIIKGSVGDEVRYLQEYLNEVGSAYGVMPNIIIDGVYSDKTEEAVKVFQRLFGIKDSGVVTSTTWNILADVYNAIIAGKRD